MPGTRGPSVGRWEHGRSGDRDSQRWLAAPISREARLIPEGIGVTREGWLASGWCGPIPEADSRPPGRCAPERTLLRSGQPRCFRLSWKRAWGGTRRSSLLTGLWITSTPQIRRCWRLKACSLRNKSGGNGCWLDNLQLCLSRHGPPGGGPALLQWPHEGTTIRCAFSMLPEEHPIGLLRRPLPDVSVRRRMAHRRDARPGRSPLEPLPTSGGRRPPRRPGANPCCRSSEPARRRVARKRARCVRLDLQAGRSKTRSRRVRIGDSADRAPSVGVQRKRACDDACRSQVDCLRPEPESRAPKGVRPA
jgi:hypothetical protein